MKTNIQTLYQSEGYRVESIHCGEGIAQVDLIWDRRFRPNCTQCGQKMSINRKEFQADFLVGRRDEVAGSDGVRGPIGCL